MPTSDPSHLHHDPYGPLKHRDFLFFLIGNMLANLGMHMQTTAVMWEIYERTGSKMALAYVGLAQIMPVLMFSIYGGRTADRHNRRNIILCAELVIALSSLSLAVISWQHFQYQGMYVFLVLIGTGRSFLQPARGAIITNLVPMELFPSAVKWNLTCFQIAAVTGPALAGGIIYLTKTGFYVYVIDAVLTLCFVALLTFIRSSPPKQSSSSAAGWDEIAAGLRFVWNKKLIFSAITLDMFAVLLGGATTLIAVYAKDILHVGERGYGVLVSAQSIGALLMSVLLAHRRPFAKAGQALLWSVAGFGLATIVFGISRSYALSLIMLMLMGALDTVSVIVRHTLVQVLTPDSMRGRVSAVNGMFIGASNELGGFESGFVAELFSPVISVVSGGIGTLLVVAMTAYLCPQLRRYGRLGSREEPAEETPSQTPL